MRWFIGAGLRGLRNVFVAIGALFFAGSVLVLANYAATQGAGTTFGSIVIGGVHFASMLICDATTANQCATIDSSGNLHVTGTGVTAGAAVGPLTGTMSMCSVLTTPPTTYSNGTGNWLDCNIDGGLRVVPTAPAPVAMQSAATGTGAGVDLNVQGYTHAIVDVNCSVACGSVIIQFLASDNSTNGAGFTTIQAFPIGGGAGVTTASTTGQFCVPVAGFNKLRTNISAYTSGTIYVWGSTISEGQCGGLTVTQGTSNWSVNINQVGGTTPVLDPCQANTATIKPISITTATTTNVITGTAAKKTYICSLVMTSAAADNVAVIEGTTGATCGAGTAALIGGTTAANGLNFAANGGVSLGNGGFAVLQTATNNNDVCLITSAATPLAVSVKYVQQ